MSTVEIWYDKPNETDSEFSWVKISRELTSCPQNAIDYAPYPKVLALMEYARPDVVLSINEQPFLAIELTQMNPSGHNLPQRFSCLVRAAELGVPSVFYYLEKSRRSQSDPNPRYVNIRVPLGQLKLSEVYDTPSVSVIWPTDPETLQAQTGNEAHMRLASYVDEAVRMAKKEQFLTCETPVVKKYFKFMKELIEKYHSRDYLNNKTYDDIVQKGECPTEKITSNRVVPPASCGLYRTRELLQRYFRQIKGSNTLPSNKKITQLLSREFSFVYSGTANKKKDGPEHPYPGYLTLLDTIYVRNEKGMTTKDRKYNLVFDLPIELEKYKEKALDRPTGLNILMEFSDLIILKDAVLVGGYLRNISAGVVLIRKI